MTHPLMQFFSFGHLPDHLKAASEPFAVAARALDNDVSKTHVFHQEAVCLQELMMHAAGLPNNLESQEAMLKLSALVVAFRRHLDANKLVPKTIALRILLEAKDCAVRAVLYKEPSDG